MLKSDWKFGKKQEYWRFDVNLSTFWVRFCRKMDFWELDFLNSWVFSPWVFLSMTFFKKQTKNWFIGHTCDVMLLLSGEEHLNSCRLKKRYISQVISKICKANSHFIYLSTANIFPSALLDWWQGGAQPSHCNK